MSKVNHPKHYNMGKIEIIDALEDWGLDKLAHEFNVVKYVARAEHKGDRDGDLLKAHWYLERRLKQLGLRPERDEPWPLGPDEVELPDGSIVSKWSSGEEQPPEKARG